VTIRVLCIGSELLAGHTINTNLAEAGQILGAEGYVLEGCQTVADDAAAIAAAVSATPATTAVLLVIGGLGPTSDDLTRDVVADVLNMPLQLDAGVLAQIRAFLASRSFTVPEEALRRQAMVPQGAEVMLNAVGTAPGLWCNAASGTAIALLPGPPHEFRTMLREQVLPRLRRRLPPQRRCLTLCLCGIGESVAAARVEELLHDYKRIIPAYCANQSRVDIRLTTTWENSAELTAAAKRLRDEFKAAMLPAETASLPAAVAQALQQQHWTMATAESCTGGGIAAAMTAVAGSSSIFRGAFVTYANEWKQQFLQVPGALLAAHGAVSPEVAQAMVLGLCRHTDADCGIAVTGIAGPGGGTEEKPVGLVYIATVTPTTPVQVQQHWFPGDRQSVRVRTVTTALNQLRLQIIADSAGCTEHGNA